MQVGKWQNGGHFYFLLETAAVTSSSLATGFKSLHRDLLHNIMAKELNNTLNLNSLDGIKSSW